jgi:tight adherence protein B
MIFLLVTLLIWVGGPELRRLLVSQERQFDEVLRRKLLLDISPRSGVVLSLGVTLGLTIWLYTLTESVLGGLIGLAIGLTLPSLVLRYLRRQRLAKLETQLVDGIHTLASGVRAGLNLVQAMQLVARDGPVPMRQEFRHLLQEYEFGIPLEEAMNNAAYRIGSGDYRLLFAALETHRQRGGDLGETLDRIAASIREIQRLENRVKALTAEGRTTARWLGAMPIVVMGILYFVVDAAAVRELFADPLGKVIVLAIIILNVIGFLWIRKIVSLDL